MSDTYPPLSWAALWMTGIMSSCREREPAWTPKDRGKGLHPASQKGRAQEWYPVLDAVSGQVPPSYLLYHPHTSKWLQEGCISLSPVVMV